MKSNRLKSSISKQINPEKDNLAIAMLPSKDGSQVTVTELSNLSSFINKNSNDDSSITFNRSYIEKLMNKNKISLEMGKILFDMFDNHEKINTIVANKNQIDSHELSKIIEEKNKEIPKQITVLRHVLSIQEKIKQEKEKMTLLFKEHVDPLEEIGITKAFADRLNHLPDLLENSKLIYPKKGSSEFYVSAELQEKNLGAIGSIGLLYTLQYQNQKSPEEAHKDYIKIITSNGLKILLAYWAYACDQKSFIFTAKLTDIMKITDRKSYFSTKEKREFWSQTQLLENTKLTFTFKHKGQLIQFKHPLLQITVTTNYEHNESYPNQITVQVLNPHDFEETTNLATAISRGTTQLDPKDIMLALTLQIRASQRRDYTHSKYDKNFLIQRGHLQKTQESNPRIVNKRLKEKLTRIKQAKAIKDFEEDNDMIIIEHNNKKKKIIPKI